MGYSRTPTQNTAGDGFPADPIDGTARYRLALRRPSVRICRGADVRPLGGWYRPAGKALRTRDVSSVGVAAVMRARQVVGFLRIYDRGASAVQDGKYLVVPLLGRPCFFTPTDLAVRVRPRSHDPEYGDDLAHDLCSASEDRCVGGVMRHQPVLAVCGLLECLNRGLGFNAFDQCRHDIAAGDG